MKPNFEEEKIVVLDLVQAMIGAITPNFRWISLRAREDGRVHFYFLLEHEDPRDREEAEDILVEYDCLEVRSEHPGYEWEVRIDDRPLEEVRPPGRPVYGRREDS